MSHKWRDIAYTGLLPESYWSMSRLMPNLYLTCFLMFIIRTLSFSRNQRTKGIPQSGQCLYPRHDLFPLATCFPEYRPLTYSYSHNIFSELICTESSLCPHARSHEFWHMSAHTLEITLIYTRVFAIVCPYKTGHMHASYVCCIVLQIYTYAHSCMNIYIHICTGSWMDAIHAILKGTYMHINIHTHADRDF